ncbi:MAG: hypothetical protein ABL962_06855 [Fimbriimonadaceae bacterium]
MKTRALILSLLMASVAFAQGPITLERAYKNGDADKYKLDLGIGTMMGEISIKLDLTQTTKTTHPNGDADIESSVANMKVQFNGSDVPNDALGGKPVAPVTQRYDKFMRPVGKQSQAGRGIESFLSLVRLTGMLVGKPLSVGQTIDIDHEDKESLTKMKGKVKVIELVNGVIKLESALQITNPQTGDKPMGINSVAKISSSDAKLLKVEGTVSGVPSAQGISVESVKFALEKF